MDIRQIIDHFQGSVIQLSAMIQSLHSVDKVLSIYTQHIQPCKFFSLASVAFTNSGGVSVFAMFSLTHL